MIVAILVCGFIVACAGACGVVVGHFLQERLTRFDDGPAPVALSPAVPIAFFFAVGATMAFRGATVNQVGLTALLAFPLSAVWYVDARKGLVPDILSLGPLAIVLAYVVFHHVWWVGFSALAAFAAFAVAALLSRGRGMGWGDAKMAALVGAVFGMPWALLVLGIACASATAVAVIRHRGAQPIAFAPYMVVLTFLTIALSVRG